MEALRRAVLEGWDTIGESIESVVPLELHMRAYQLIESTPALLAAYLRRSAELEEEIARVIASARDSTWTRTRDRASRWPVFGELMRITGRLWSEATTASRRSAS